MIELKPCPFCGAKITPFIFKDEDKPAFWRNNLWFFDNMHSQDCFLKYDPFFDESHFGEAENGEPTEILLKYIDKWNRRVEP